MHKESDPGDIFHFPALRNLFGGSDCKYLELFYLHTEIYVMQLISAKLHGENDLLLSFYTYTIAFLS